MPESKLNTRVHVMLCFSIFFLSFFCSFVHLFLCVIPNVVVGDTWTVDTSRQLTVITMFSIFFSHYFCSCAIYKKKCTLNQEI